MTEIAGGHDPQLLRGVLPMLILTLLSDDESYGYQLVERLRTLGLTGLATGAVYPVLSRFERDGLLSSHLQQSASGPARKYYLMTELGIKARIDSVHQWQEISSIAERGLSIERTQS